MIERILNLILAKYGANPSKDLVQRIMGAFQGQTHELLEKIVTDAGIAKQSKFGKEEMAEWLQVCVIDARCHCVLIVADRKCGAVAQALLAGATGCISKVYCKDTGRTGGTIDITCPCTRGGHGGHDDDTYT